MARIRSIPILVVALGLTFLLSATAAGCSDSDNESQVDSAADVVASELGYNELNVLESDLEEIANPKGDGTFVYVAKTSFSGVERYLLWMVVDGQAYALNGATKDVTPNLDWPRDAPASTWKRTNLDQFSATEAVSIVFGAAEPTGSGSDESDDSESNGEDDSGLQPETETTNPDEPTQQQSFTVNEYRIYQAIIETPMSVSETQAIADAAARYGVSTEEAEMAVDKVQAILFENSWFGSPESEIQHASDWTAETP